MPPSRTSPRQWAPMGALLSILLLTVWVFAPVSTASFVNYNDDRDFLTGNPGIASGLSSASLRYIVSDQAYYATGGPLTWLSHLIDIELFGWSPAGHHITSVVIHLINTGPLELEPSRTDWRFTAAMMLKAVGRRQDAIRELETVLRQNPAHAGARQELAELRRLT